MRPRHKAAENGPVDLFQVGTHFLASMRPRHKAAENHQAFVWPEYRPARASMRPRHKAAENGVAAPPVEVPVKPLQ